jgi:sulfur relay protein TusD/DsrE
MKIVLLLRRSPSDFLHHTAYQYALSALKKNHTIACIFFYSDAVYHAIIEDEDDTFSPWKLLHLDHAIPLLCCQTALTSRGISHALKNPYSLSSMDVFIQTSITADKVITF